MVSRHYWTIAAVVLAFLLAAVAVRVAHAIIRRLLDALDILAGAFVVVRGANLVIDHLQFKLSRRHADTDLEWQRRATTLGGILTSLVSTVVGFIAILMLLREL